jgi:hypothetical protein
VTHKYTYTDCDGVESSSLDILSEETINVCGCCGLANSNLVTITVGANCIDGECPVPPTTTTTTTIPSCNCFDTEITITSETLASTDNGQLTVLYNDCFTNPYIDTFNRPGVYPLGCVDQSVGITALGEVDGIEQAFYVPITTGSPCCNVVPTTTTTTTTLFFPSASPCVWSRDIDIVGSIDVYDVVTNTTVSISVPNDFATPTGITMQASTNNKLWIGDGLNTIKEWDIMQETLGLTFVRNITVGSFGTNESKPTVIAAIDDTTILLGNDWVSGGQISIRYWDISSPSISIIPGNAIATKYPYITNSFGASLQITGLVYTNAGNVIISCRYNFVSYANNVGNFIREYIGLPNPSFSIPWLPSIGAIRVQDTIDFTPGYTGRKAFDLFGWNKLFIRHSSI